MRTVARAGRRLMPGRRLLAAVMLVVLVVSVPATKSLAGEEPPADPTAENPQDTCSDSESPLDCVMDVCDSEEEWWLHGTKDGPEQWVDEYREVCTQARAEAGYLEEADEDGVVSLDSAWCEAWLILGVTVALAPVANGIKEECYQGQRQEAYEVLQSGGRVRISCTYSPPIGADVVGIGERDADLATHTFGYMQEVLKILGWQPRMNVEIHPDAPEWWARELLLNHECHLATRWPTRCQSLEDQAMGTGTPQPVPATDDGGEYNPATDGRTPWMGNTSILPDPCVGDYPSNQYDIGYAADGFVDVDDTVIGTLTNTFFSFGKGAMQVSFTFVNYAFEFDLVNGLGSMVDRAADVYETRIVGDMQLSDIAWFALVGWLAILVVTRRFSLAAGEAIVAILFLSIFTAILQAPRDYMEGAASTMKDVSTSILQLDCAEGETNARVIERRCAVSGLSRIQRDLHRFFVHEPYQFINWNWSEQFEQECADRMDHVLSTGPHGGHDWPRIHMARGDVDDLEDRDQSELNACQKAALYNAVPNWDRMLMALLAGVMATMVAAVLAAMGLTVLLAKFIVAMLFAVAPIAAALAVLPSSGRRLATAWMTTLLQAIVVSIGMSIVLSLMMIALDAMADTVSNLTLIERWITIIVVLLIVWYARKRFLTTMQTVASNIGDRLARPDLAGAGGGGYGGGGFGGGGYGGRPPGGSMFGATRMSGAEVFGVGTSALTAASTAGALAMRAGAVGLRGVSAPFRAGGRMAIARAASNRIAGQNVGLWHLQRVMDGLPGVGGAGGGAGGGAAPVVPARNQEAVLLQQHARSFLTRRGYRKRVQAYGEYNEETGELLPGREGYLNRQNRRANFATRTLQRMWDGTGGVVARFVGRSVPWTWTSAARGDSVDHQVRHPPVPRIHIGDGRVRRRYRRTIIQNGVLDQVGMTESGGLGGGTPAAGGDPLAGGTGGNGGRARGGWSPGGGAGRRRWRWMAGRPRGGRSPRGGAPSGGSPAGSRPVIDVDLPHPGDRLVAGEPRGGGSPRGGSSGGGSRGPNPVRLGRMDELRLGIARFWDGLRRGR